MKKNIPWIILVIFIVSVIIAGVVFISLYYYHAEEKLENEQYRHMQDLGYTIDQSLSFYNTYCQNYIGNIVDSDFAALAEKEWAQTGSTNEFAHYFDDITESGTAYSLLILNGQKHLYFSDGSPEDISLVSPISADAHIMIYQDKNGTVYLAYPCQSEKYKLTYLLLVNTSFFYEQILSEYLYKENWILFYYPGENFFIQNYADYPTIQQLSYDEIQARKDGYTVLANSEYIQKITYQQYSYTDTKNQSHACHMVTIPSTLCNNGVFAIGICVYSSDFLSSFQLSYHTLMRCYIIIGLAVFVLLLLIFRGLQRTNKAEEEIRILNTKERAIDEITEKIRMMEHHERLESIGVLTSSIAHEINNLLTPIMGYSVLCLNSVSPENNGELCDQLAAIYSASSKAKQIVARLTTFSKKNLDTELTLFSPDELVRNLYPIYYPSLKGKVIVNNHLQCPEPCIQGNATQISQMILNLILNATHAMMPDGGTLSIITERKNGKVILKVSDTGCGIPDDVRNQIFTPFFTTKKDKGTGLGLSIVQRIAEQHNAEMQLDSAVGEGTTFTFLFPDNSDKAEKTNNRNTEADD